jgi:hypothetical protein
VHRSEQSPLLFSIAAHALDQYFGFTVSTPHCTQAPIVRPSVVGSDAHVQAGAGVDPLST